MKKELLEAQAKLIVRTGVNLQKGQYVVIRTDVSQEYMASLVAKECYEAGAKQVFVKFESALVSKVDYLNASTETLSEVKSYEEEEQKFYVEKNPVLIWLDADDPDGLTGIDAKKMATIRANRFKVLGKYREQRENKYQWVIVGVPSIKWAKKVFPTLSDEEAVEKLWEAILTTARAIDGNGIENWNKHEEDLKKRCNYLNSLNLVELRYKSTTGTDFKVGLIPGVIFLGGGEKTLDGTFFQPNIPSEECFTSPMRGKAEGIVYASKPLVYNGQLINNFNIRFHEGKAVEVHAETGEEVLKSILELDEGSAYLGECALVPFDSPINNTGILFYNTLFDENAACHLALGRGFTNLYPDFEKYSEEELHSFGINKSLSHVDFMIGDKDLDITGITSSGKEVAIFRKGAWAF